MPSPIVHTALGYVVYRVFEPQQSTPALRSIGPLPGLFLYAAAIAMLPDLDAVLGVLMGDFGRYHNNATHSLIVGLAVAFVFAVIFAVLQKSGFWKWFFITLLSYESHILLDFFTVGRGVLALWPLSQLRFSSPVPLFYGFHWSEGVFSLLHVWTFLTESVSAAFIILVVHFLLRRSRTRAKGIRTRDTALTSPRRPLRLKERSDPSQPGDDN